MPKLYYVFLFICSFVLAIFSTSFFSKIAIKYDVLDKPTHRKTHKRIVPLWGGLSIYSSFLLTVLLAILASISFSNLLTKKEFFFGKTLFGVLLGAFLVTLVGAIDDKYGIPPKLKLSGQLIAAIFAVVFGVIVVGFKIPGINKYINLFPLVGAIIAIMWITFIVNSINFIDGVDGLAAGITVIASLAFFIVSIQTIPKTTGWIGKGGINLASSLSLILAGSTSGFLIYNFYPAKIFLGDSGSMLLGFLLATITIIGSLKTVAFVTLIVPILIIGLPFFDVMFSIIRRIKAGQPISKGDKGHLHHKLIEMGLTQTQVVLILYGINIFLAVFAIFLNRKL